MTLPRVMEIKTKINKLDLAKLKSFFTMNKTIRKMKKTFRIGKSESETVSHSILSDFLLLDRL